MSAERFNSREEIEFKASNVAEALGVEHKKIKNEFVDDEISTIFLIRSPGFTPSESLPPIKTHLQETEITIIGKRLMLVSYHPQTKLILNRLTADISKAEKIVLETGERAVIFNSVNDSEIRVHSNAFYTVNEKHDQGPSMLIIEDSKKE